MGRSVICAEPRIEADILLSNSSSIGEYLRFAHSLADASGEVISGHFRRITEVQSKGEGRGFDPVSIADRQAETVLRGMIEARYPQHGIFGEEEEDKASAAPLRWILDPIDGTRSFLMGLPLWGTLIALYDGATPLFGIMDQPFTGERYEGSGAGAFLLRGGSRTPLRTRRCAGIETAILGATDPAMFAADKAAAFQRLAERVRMRRFGGDCYLYCALAAGWVDLVVENDLQHYDILPLVPIVEAAGGVISDWRGERLAGGGNVCASGDAALHAAALEILRRS